MAERNRSGPLKPGDTFLDKYEVRRELGSGGHAFVYECFDMFLSRVVAIKVIKSGMDSAANIHARARTEAQLLVRIDHENLVKVIDAGVWQGLVYIVMEYLDGRNLREVLRDVGRLSVAEALAIAIEIAGGMTYAHGKKVIHRDLKPENIFILIKNAAKVLDFGIAKVRGLDGLDPKTTHPDMLQGTLLYMSPEHLQGHPVTELSDIFALGTMLFEALHAHPLRVGEEPVGRDQAAWMQMFKVPPLLSDLDPSIPRHVAKAIHRALLKVPGERYASMQDLRDALLGALRRHLQEDGPRGLVVTRELYRPQPAQPQAPHRDTLRAAPVLTNQVTVKAPVLQSGYTEPLHPRSPSFLQPASSDPGRGVSVDVPPKLARVTPARPSNAPPSSEQPTIWVKPNASAASAPVSPPASARRSAPSLVTPGTPPPVATGMPPAAPSLPIAPWLQDRTLKLAAIAAVLSGVIGGTAYGVFATNSNRAAAAAPVSAPTTVTSAAVAPQDSPQPEPVSPAVAAAPEPQPAATPVIAPTAAAPEASRTPLALRATAPTPAAAKARTTPKVDSVDSGLPTLDEVQRRFQELDRRTAAKPSPAAAKPATSSTPATPRPRQTVF